MENSSNGELFAALAKAQSQYQSARKDKTSSYYKNHTYASIEDMIQATRPALTSNGLAVTQEPIYRDGQLYLQTVLGHSSGAFRESLWPINPAKEDIQDYGSLMTYVSRYSYRLITGVETNDDDDDGNSDRIAREKIRSAPKAPPKRPDNVVTDEQLEILEMELDGHKDIAQTLMKTMGITTLSNVKRDHFPAIIKRIQEIKRGKKA